MLASCGSSSSVRGYIGGRLVPLLAARRHEFILMSGDARPLAARFPQATVVVADLLDRSTLPLALEGIQSPTTWRTRWGG